MGQARELNADIIGGVVKTLLAARYDDPKPIPQCHYEWWQLATSEEKQVAIAAPRGHAKSTAITFAYVLCEILFRKSSHVLVMSANEELAAMFVKDIKVELLENEDLVRMFGFKKLLKDAESEVIGQFDDGHKFRIVAKGAQQRMRGLKWERKRPDLLVGDDLEDDETVLNADRREKFKRWFYGAAKPIIKSGGRIRIVGTIVHEDSLLEGFMPNPKKDEGVSEDPLRIWASGPVAGGWRSVKYRAHDKDFNNILWPEQYDARELQRIRIEYESQGISDLYSQEYLNIPIDDSKAYFRLEDFLALTDSQKDMPGTWYCAVDFAISKESRRDFTVITGVMKDYEGNLQVRYCAKGRWDSLEIIEEMFIAQKRLNPSVFFVERGMIEKAIGPFLYEEMSKRGIFLNLEPMLPTKDKISRARPLQGRMRAGTVYFDKQAPWYIDMEEEMRMFPRSTHDDIVDSLSWIGLGLQMMPESDTPEELEEEEYQEAFKLSGFAEQGRNPYTGY